jgi:hypothetical protein
LFYAELVAANPDNYCAKSPEFRALAIFIPIIIIKDIC